MLLTPSIKRHIFRKRTSTISEEGSTHQRDSAAMKHPEDFAPASDPSTQNFTTRHRNRLIAPLQPRGRSRFTLIEAKSSLNVYSRDYKSTRMRIEEGVQKMMSNIKELNKISAYHDKRFDIQPILGLSKKRSPQEWATSILTKPTIDLIEEIKQRRESTPCKGTGSPNFLSRFQTPQKPHSPREVKIVSKTPRTSTQKHRFFREAALTPRSDNNSQHQTLEMQTINGETSEKPENCSLIRSSSQHHSSFYLTPKNKEHRNSVATDTKALPLQEADPDDQIFARRKTPKVLERTPEKKLTLTLSTGLTSKIPRVRVPAKRVSDLENTLQSSTSRTNSTRRTVGSLFRRTDRDTNITSSRTTRHLTPRLTPRHSEAKDKFHGVFNSQTEFVTDLAKLIFQESSQKKSESKKLRRSRKKLVDNEIKGFIDDAYSELESNSYQTAPNYLLNKYNNTLFL